MVLRADSDEMDTHHAVCEAPRACCCSDVGFVRGMDLVRAKWRSLLALSSSA